MTADQIFARLKEFAPNVLFTVTFTHDPYHEWDGDGPDPVNDGLIAHDVDVTAMVIHQGNMLEGTGSLGGCYEDDEPDMDIGGYLPQLLEEAVVELIEELPDNDPKKNELLEVRAFIKQEMKDRYDEQQKQHK